MTVSCLVAHLACIKVFPLEHYILPGVDCARHDDDLEDTAERSLDDLLYVFGHIAEDEMDLGEISVVQQACDLLLCGAYVTEDRLSLLIRDSPT